MDSLETLRLQLAQAIADAEEGATLAEINQTLIDMSEVLRARKDGVMAAPVVNVTNQVNPTPIQNNVTVQRSGGFKLSFTYDAHDRITGGLVTPINPKGG